MDINVIASGKDGAELKREKFRNSWHICCDGKDDHEEITDAMTRTKHGLSVVIPTEDWERIFGGK